MTRPARRGAAPSQSATDRSEPRLADSATQRRREWVSSAIEEAALQLFATQSIADTTVEQIAESAGVAVRTFYRYFGNKDEVLAAYPSRQASRLAATLLARPHGERPFTALRHAVEEAAENLDDAELRRWLGALGNAGSIERVAQMAIAAMGSELTRAMAARVQKEPSDLWSAMAGATAATAMVVAARHAGVRSGAFTAEVLAALDLAGRGLDNVDPTPTKRRAAPRR